jgi:pyruvate dehydrogenase E2 component (dihydrolipoamide acetyltransferase)
MPVSVTMPRLGESVSEGTVTRWLKQAGERVEADEPLLEVSTDKVDTEIPAPASGVLAEIKVGEDETVEVGVELAVINEGGEGDGGGSADGAQASASASTDSAQTDSASDTASSDSARTDPAPAERAQAQATDDESDAAQGELAAGPEEREQLAAEDQQGGTGQREAAGSNDDEREPEDTDRGQAEQTEESQPQQEPQAGSGQDDGQQERGTPPQREPQGQSAEQPAQASQQADRQPTQGSSEQAHTTQPPTQESQPAQQRPGAQAPSDGGGDGAAYVTPLVRKLAAEEGVDLSTIKGSGIGGRIRKQDVLDAARAAGGGQGEAAQAAEEPAASTDSEPSAPAQPTAQPPARDASARPAAPAQAGAQRMAAQTHVRGRTEQLSRLRKVIATRMVESLQTSAQLTTVVEVDVTRIARLRAKAKAEFEAREGVRLSFLPFFALATVEALKAHPNVNSSIDLDAGTVTHHDAVHLGIAVDTERGLLVPVVGDAQDLNIGGLARKIADIAERTRSGQVSPDELGGGTFTLTNTGSRGALFDTPIINQPQVGILGTGAVVKRPVVIDDPDLGETIAVRSMVYLALTYDHRIIDGADAARFLGTVKARLEEGNFESELGLI